MTNPTKKSKSLKFEFDEVHENTSTELITITADKLKIILLEHLGKTEISKNWHTPLSLLVTIVLVFCSAQFKEAFYLSAEAWKAIFVIAGIASLIWFICALLSLKNYETLEDVIKIIKNKA